MEVWLSSRGLLDAIECTWQIGTSCMQGCQIGSWRHLGSQGVSFSWIVGIFTLSMHKPTQIQQGTRTNAALQANFPYGIAPCAFWAPPVTSRRLTCAVCHIARVWYCGSFMSDVCKIVGFHPIPLSTYGWYAISCPGPSSSLTLWLVDGNFTLWSFNNKPQV